MKFSDILKRKSAPEPTPADLTPALAAAPAPAAPSAPSQPAAPPVNDESDEAIERRVEAQALKATEVYTEAMAAARTLYKAAQNPQTAGAHPLPKEIIFKLLALMQSGNEEILALADRSAPDNYLFGHAVNVTIFSLRLGLALHLKEQEFLILGLGAFLHDLGMMNHLPLALKPARLAESEMTDIRRHPQESQNLLALFPGLTGEPLGHVHAIVGQVHERSDGSGYPNHSAGDVIHPLAKIVSVCDVYEAITHNRAWRGRALPHEALKLLIEKHERQFEPGTVKTLIEALSLYPPGSFVRLNTGEMGRVIFTHPGLPTRPKVKIMIDPAGAPLSGPRVVNLATQPILYVAEAVDETRVHCLDPKLALSLKAQRWWVKGL